MDSRTPVALPPAGRRRRRRERRVRRSPNRAELGQQLRFPCRLSKGRRRRPHAHRRKPEVCNLVEARLVLELFYFDEPLHLSLYA